MERFRHPLIALLSLAAFLIATTPASAVAVRCPWVWAPKVQEKPKAHAGGCSCPACQQTAPTSESPDDDAPLAPRSSACPFGCCWCSVAKVPSCAIEAPHLVQLVACPDAQRPEAALLLPPPHGIELMRPPRA